MIVGDYSWLRAGTYTIDDAVRPHNEHRIFFARLLLLALGSMSQLDARWEMIASALFIGASILMVTWYTRDPLCAAIVALLLVSLRQQENLFVGFQICIPMCAFFVIAGLVILDVFGDKRRGQVGAMMCGIAASFCFANGLLIWPSALVILWLRRAKREFIVLWCVVGLMTIGAFFSGLPPESQGPTVATTYWLAHPIDTMLYFLANQGAIFTKTATESVLVGFVVVAIELVLIVMAVRARNQELAFSTACIIFGLLSSLLIAKGRALLGIDQALASRYVTITAIGWSGIVIACARIAHRRSLSRRAVTVLVAVAIVLAVEYVSEQRLDYAFEANTFYPSQLGEVAAIRRFESIDDPTLASATNYPSAPYVRQVLQYLQLHRLSTFSEQ